MARIVYTVLLFAIIGYGLFLCLDCFIAVAPLLEKLTDPKTLKPNTATELTERHAQSFYSKQRFAGYFYDLNEADGQVCLAYSRSHLTSQPTEIIELLPEISIEFEPLAKKSNYRCVAYDNLKSINDSFYIGGLSRAVVIAFCIGCVLLVILEIVLLICCKGWCGCACNACCLLCQSERPTNQVIYTDAPVIYPSY